jgi:hypothetical protein
MKIALCFLNIRFWEIESNGSWIFLAVNVKKRFYVLSWSWTCLLNLFEFIAGKAFTDFNKIIHQENLEYLFGLQM